MFSKKACAICCATTVGSAGAVALGKNKMGGGVAVGGNAFAFLQTKTMKQMEKAGAAELFTPEEIGNAICSPITDIACNYLGQQTIGGEGSDWEKRPSPSLTWEMWKKLDQLKEQGDDEAYARMVVDVCCKQATAPRPSASPMGAFPASPGGGAPAPPKVPVGGAAAPSKGAGAAAPSKAGGETPRKAGGEGDAPAPRGAGNKKKNDKNKKDDGAKKGGSSTAPQQPPAPPVANAAPPPKGKVGGVAAPPKDAGAAVPPEGSCDTPPKASGGGPAPNGAGNKAEGAGADVPPQRGGEKSREASGNGPAPNGAGGNKNQKDDGNKKDGSSAC